MPGLFAAIGFPAAVGSSGAGLSAVVWPLAVQPVISTSATTTIVNRM
jgi:hypothetical protein